MTGLRLTDVRFSYDSRRDLLKGVNLHVQSGEITALLGNNGAGKTTTFRIVAGLLHPGHGDVEVGGVSLRQQPTEARRTLGYVPEQHLLYPSLSALENLNMFGLLWGVDHEAVRQRSHELLTSAGLWPMRNEWVENYSTGARQKLSLCVALLHQPRVLLMDEPFTGLDLDSALWARTHLQAFARAGGSILFATHMPELAEAFAHSVAVLRDGVVAAHASQD